MAVQIKAPVKGAAKVEIAGSLLKMGMSLDQITQATGLTLEDMEGDKIKSPTESWMILLSMGDRMCFPTNLPTDGVKRG